MKPDVLIYGGGVVGWSTALALLRQAPALKVKVVDPNPAQASSLRGTGGFRNLFGSPVHVAMSQFSRRQFHAFPTEVSFRNVGYLLLTESEATADRWARDVQRFTQQGVRASLLTPVEIARQWPVVDVEDVRVGLWGEDCGVFNGPEVVRFFQRESMDLGAEFAPSYAGDRPNRVVLAAGAWSRATMADLPIDHAAQQAGASLPVEPEKHQLVGFDGDFGLPEDLPMVVDADTGFHVRVQGTGVLCGYRFTGLDDSNLDFEAAALPSLLRDARHRIPALARCPATPDRAWAGYYAVTPDRHGILDTVGSVTLATGFGGHGIMHSPAIGQAAADLVLRGECSTFDLYPLRLSRFQQGALTPEPFVF